jgi:hypothetical protein
MDAGVGQVMVGVPFVTVIVTVSVELSYAMKSAR